MLLCGTSRLEKGDLSCSQVLLVLQTLHFSSTSTGPGEAQLQTVSDSLLRESGADVGDLQGSPAGVQVDLYDDRREPTLLLKNTLHAVAK